MILNMTWSGQRGGRRKGGRLGGGAVGLGDRVPD
jgi:hypothetical protein